MRTYIYSVVSMAALGGIALIAAPEGIRSGIKKHMKLICSLCLLCVMISPLSELFENIENIGGEIGSFEGDSGLESMYESIYDGNMEMGYGDGIGEAVKKKLLEGFGVPENESRVEVSFADGDGDGFREPSKITVVLSGGSIFKNPRNIERYISDAFECECVCAIE